jgi:tripartite-type tricarboxylate transporter receptor subunit TctC
MVALGVLLLAQFGASLNCVSAESVYPTRTVQIIVPFTAGGNTSVLTRLMADRLASAFHQPFIVVNKPGAGGNIGAAALVASRPDGYTLLMTPPGPPVIDEYLYSSLPFDPQKAFAPITMVARFPNVLVVHPSLGVKTIQELVDKAKANPDQINYATSGVGTTGFLSMALFLALAKIRMNQIPYKGTGDSVDDIITGRVSLMIENLGPLLPFIQSGQLIALGVSTTKPVSVLPDVPPIDSVIPGYEASSWNALVAPGETPEDVINKLSLEANRILREPEMVARLRAIGAEPVGGTPAEVLKFFAEDRVRWKHAVDVANLTKFP